MARTLLSRDSVLTVMIFCMIGFPAFADVTVEGTIYEAKGKGRYEPLGGVQIQAYRDGAPILTRAVVSQDKDGRFSLRIQDGEPFDVLFHGGEFVPELTKVAGIPNGKNVVQIALYSKAQYEKSTLAKSVPLREKVTCVLRMLPKDDAATASIRKQFPQ